MSSVATTSMLHFATSENQQHIKQMIRDFCEKRIRPNVMEWDEAQVFPREIFRELGELGVMGVLVPEEYGGAGLSYHEYITADQSVSRLPRTIHFVPGIF